MTSRHGLGIGWRPDFVRAGIVPVRPNCQKQFTACIPAASTAHHFGKLGIERDLTAAIGRPRRCHGHTGGGHM